MKCWMIWVLLLAIPGHSLADPATVAAEFGREILYPGTILTTPSGKTVKIQKLRYAYTEEANRRLLGEIARMGGIIEAYSSVNISHSSYAKVLQEEIEFHKTMIVQRDIWLEQERYNTEAYRQLLRDLLSANRALKRRFPNIARLVFGSVLIKEGVKRIK